MEKLIRVTLNQNQIDALVSLIYNIGIGNFSESSMLKFINSGEFEKAAGEFSKWRMANGKVINGLERRRGQEAALFRKE
jgi:lysozyme